MLRSNCHTHTLYCDGKNTAEEMINRAVELGFVSLGFSGHCPMSFNNEWGMTKEKTELYVKEINELKAKYKNKIEIFCGIELDEDYTDIDPDSFDYIIASVHQIHKNGKIYSIDLSPDELSECVREAFDGSWNEMAKHYYSDLADYIIRQSCDVVGHFDLITKFNGSEPLFDESDCQYRQAAIEAVDKILKAKPEVIFEINTGAMFRRGNKKPYPADFILEHLKKAGAKITLTSDCHCIEAMDFAFDEVTKMLKRVGFEESYILSGDCFKKIAL